MNNNSSDAGEIQTGDYSETFPDYEGEEERISGDFYNAPASPITVPYCPPRPPSRGILCKYF